MTGDGTRLGRDLADLERTDPAARLQAAVDALAVRRDVPRTRFRPSTPDRPCEVLR